MTTRQNYVNAVVRNYLRLPGTPLRGSRGDRHFAGVLHEQRVSLRVVYAAFALAIARREIRSPSLPRLPTIRTLRFFQGAIDEVLETKPDPAYIHYLAAKIRPLVLEKELVLRTTTHGSAQPHGAPDALPTPSQIARFLTAANKTEAGPLTAQALPVFLARAQSLSKDLARHEEHENELLFRSLDDASAAQD